MNWLRPSSWSLTTKIFVILFIVLIIRGLINTPLNVEAFLQINRDALGKVVFETANYQQQSVENDFTTALDVMERFFESRQTTLLFPGEWLDATGRQSQNATQQLEHLANLSIGEDIIEINPELFSQVWLLTLDGRVVLNVVKDGIEPRFDIAFDRFADGTSLTAFRAGTVIAQAQQRDVDIDLVIEEVNGLTSVQMVSVINIGTGEAVGIIVVELDNQGIFIDNMVTVSNSQIYSFVASPNNSQFPIASASVLQSDLVSLNTQAVRSSLPAREAVRYNSENRQVIGFYTPILTDLRNDIVFVTEINEETALNQATGSILNVLLPTFVAEFIIILVTVWLISRIAVRPLNYVSQAIRSIGTGDYNSPIAATNRDDEIGYLAQNVVNLRQQIQELMNNMTERVEARSRDLLITQEIGRVAITESDLDNLMNHVVQLIVERFSSIYHAQIFIIEGDYAVLKASTGKAGEQLLRRGHRLQVGSLSVIGQVTQQKQTIVARDTAVSEVHRRNEFLQETRSELAIPLQLDSQIIGVLDVQSTQRDSFEQDLIIVLETMADQISIAIENTRLYQESRLRLTELEHATRIRTQRDWEDYMYTQRTQALTSSAGAKTLGNNEEIRQHTLQNGETFIGTLTERDTIPVAIPIQIRGQTLGVIEWELKQNDFNYNRILLAEELAARLAVSLDNARLVQASQQSVENERIVNTITTKISGQTDIEEILQTAIREVGQALRAPRVNIRLNRSNGENGHHANGSTASSDDEYGG